MQQQRAPKDLLQEWAREKVEAHRTRNRWLAGVGVLLVVAITAEAVNNNSYVLLTDLILAALGLIGISLALCYAGFMFYIGWSYARFVRSQGLTRPSPIHLGSMVLMSSFLALFPAASTISEHISQPFWIAILFAVWTNILCSCMGYLSGFLMKNQS